MKGIIILEALKEVKEERNYGIDLLRVFAMFFVVVLHSLGRGGILSNTEFNSTQYKFSWFLEIVAYCAVDMFGLISGYVSYTKKEKTIKFSNYLKIWLQVVFYGLVITFIFNLINSKLICWKDYVINLFPVTNRLYWYVTAYTGLFIFMPFLNNGIRKIDDGLLKKLFIVIIAIFTIINSISDKFNLYFGYSAMWLIILYVLGAIINKCNILKSAKSFRLIISIFVLYIITYLYKIYGFEIETSKFKITKDLLVSYTSPTILLIAIFYLILFSRLRFNNFFKKIITFSASSALSIYILNTNRLVWEHVMQDIFINISKVSVVKIYFYVITFSIVFVVISILIDKIRLLLFKIFHINDLIKKIENLLNILLNKIINYI